MPQRFPSQRPIAENRCAAFFVSPVAPDSETTIAAAGADEVIDAIAKTVAELTSQQDGMIRQ